jgi:hypothetical protein
LILSGCDLGKPEPVSGVGPPVHLIGAFPPDGCGIGEDPDCTVPTNVALTLRFDRFLNPVSAIRQSLRVYAGDPAVGVPFSYDVVYDPIERVVEYRVPPGGAYKPHTLYVVELFVAEAPSDPGFRAFDGAPLAAGELPLRFSFITGDAPMALPAPPPAPTCDDVVKQVFGTLGNCSGAACHRKGDNLLDTGVPLGDAPHQLWLESSRHFAQSAIGRVARQTEVGDISGGPSAPQSPRFGVRLALIEPDSPGGSYLLYKLLLGASNFEPCRPDSTEDVCRAAVDPPVSSHPFLPLAEGETIAPAPEELERLREWFVRGEPMPRGRGNVRLEGLRALSSFIEHGARCD